jgi:hypothetical protein
MGLTTMIIRITCETSIPHIVIGNDTKSNKNPCNFLFKQWLTLPPFRLKLDPAEISSNRM